MLLTLTLLVTGIAGRNVTNTHTLSNGDSLA